eukprot:scaffold4834_cov179-Skeletonema_marinoi.AAC.6
MSFTQRVKSHFKFKCYGYIYISTPPQCNTYRNLLKLKEILTQCSLFSVLDRLILVSLILIPNRAEYNRTHSNDAAITSTAIEPPETELLGLGIGRSHQYSSLLQTVGSLSHSEVECPLTSIGEDQQHQIIVVIYGELIG